ncbi:unnamed protein product [Calicophoron daubneyi]|uniref:Transmembrane protein 242 n=1 Tax=Calicophoron daubneyi TaxID=300641 RepID=A0AAV2T9B7_CALDB
MSSTRQPEPKISAKGPGVRDLVLILGAAGLSAVAGFAITISIARKADPLAFAKGFRGHGPHSIPKNATNETPLRFAARTLGLASLITVGSVSGLSLLFRSLVGVKDMAEFSAWAKAFFPPSWRLVTADPSSNIRTYSELKAYISSTSGERAHHEEKPTEK